MRYIFIALSLLSLNAQAQQVDGTIREQHYTSYFCNSTKGPLYVVYKLSNAGNGCTTEIAFTNNTKYTTATDKDYKHSTYSKAQLASAANYADCELAQKTYRYYNCLPMCDILKNGIWKNQDETIAIESQADELRITSGAIFDNPPATIGDGLAVPKYFYKIVYSYNSHSYKHAYLFTNDMSAEVRDVPIKELERMAGYKIWYE